MEVRYNQETEAMVMKNGLKEPKDGKESQSILSKSFQKEQQDSFSSSGSVDNCEKSRASAGDPDYCRRILVRGKTSLSFYSRDSLVRANPVFYVKNKIATQKNYLQL